MSVSHHTTVGLAQASRPANGLFWLRSVCSGALAAPAPPPPPPHPLSRVYIRRSPFFPVHQTPGRTHHHVALFLICTRRQPSIPDPSHGRAPVATATPQFWGRGAPRRAPLPECSSLARPCHYGNPLDARRAFPLSRKSRAKTRSAPASIFVNHALG
jgi:hypothetical protein